METHKKSRMLYIDNIRILLITLIVLLHLAITYGAPGSWYYNEIKFEELDLFSTVIYTLYNATVQAFSLGFFFMISAYFTAASYDRNGARKLLASRFLRLGIPLLFQIFVIQPVLVDTLWGSGKPFLTFYVDYFTHLRTPGVGPLWFIEALLIFSVIYVIYRSVTGPHDTQIHRERALPGNFTIALFSLTVGLISFTVRIWLPVGWTFRLLNFQFPHFAQYISMFIAGHMAYRGNWFEKITDKKGRLWLTIAMLLIVSLPVFIFISFTQAGIEPFLGGINWKSLYYSLWEQFVCVGMIIGLSTLFRSKFNHQGTLAKAMSASAYTVFIIHAPVLIFLALALKNITLYPLLKFIIVAPVAVSLCFMIGILVKKLPYARKIL